MYVNVENKHIVVGHLLKSCITIQILYISFQ